MVTIRKLGIAWLTACFLAASGAWAAEGPVLVFGGTAGIGLQTVRVLRERGIPVTVFVRPTSDRKPLEPLGVSFVVGDVLHAKDVAAAFEGRKFAAVISSLGGRFGEPRPEHIGNANINNAAKAAGVKRVIQISAIGTSRNRDRAQPPADAHWSEQMTYAKIQGEKHLMASGLDWTILRPGLLQDDPPTGNSWLTEQTDIAGSISRADVALVIADLLDDAKAVGKAYSVIDKNKQRPFGVPPREPFFEGPQAEIDAVLNMMEQWRVARTAGDVDRVVALHHPDVRIMTRGRALLEGHAGVRTFYAENYSKDSARQQYGALHELRVFGPVAFMTGRFLVTDPGRNVEDPGYYLIVLRRSANGAWLIYRDIDTPSPDGLNVKGASGSGS